MAGEKIREHVGRVFVGLTAGIFGGEIQSDSNNSETGAPDIIHWSRNQAYESKGSISTDHHKIRPEQIEHYGNLMKQEFPLDNPEVYYFLWQHKRRTDREGRLSSFSGKKLERNLISKINRLLIVSYDVIEAGSRVWDTTGENSWGTQYMFRASERTRLTNETEKTLSDFFNLNPCDYNISTIEVPANLYSYGGVDIPEFSIRKVINKEWKGVRRI
jgi:hypothetical protein